MAVMFSLDLFSNMWIWGGIFFMIMAQLAFTYLPVMNQLFHTAPIGLNDWLHIIAVGFTIHIVIALDKIIRLYFDRRAKRGEIESI
jgi:magnesium-transporting ATPase (P-type)